MGSFIRKCGLCSRLRYLTRDAMRQTVAFPFTCAMVGVKCSHKSDELAGRTVRPRKILPPVMG